MDLPLIWRTAYDLERLRENLSIWFGREVEIILTDARRCLGRVAIISTVDPPWNDPHFAGFAIDIIARIVKIKTPVPLDKLGEVSREIFKDGRILIEDDHVHISCK